MSSCNVSCFEDDYRSGKKLKEELCKELNDDSCDVVMSILNDHPSPNHLSAEKCVLLLESKLITRPGTKRLETLKHAFDKPLKQCTILILVGELGNRQPPGDKNLAEELKQFSEQDFRKVLRVKSVSKISDGDVKQIAALLKEDELKTVITEPQNGSLA